jgi:2-oxoglutarate ferredoxin oxidoreductase subunit beta
MTDAIDTTAPPSDSARKVGDFKPSLLLTEDHHLCAGCGHPVAIRIILETLEQLGLQRNTVALFGHGCSGMFNESVDVDLTIALHGRAPAAATGIKRMRPDLTVWTMQGDGDMVNEGLAEILQAAGRGERLTCFLLNNGVFGDTGGQMTATTPIGQRTKTSVEGREPSNHGYPFPLVDMMARLPGVGYAARGSVYNAAGVTATRKLVRDAFLNQHEGSGLAIVEILTMCPTGWFLPASAGPDYMMKTLGEAYPLGTLKGVKATDS